MVTMDAVGSAPAAQATAGAAKSGYWRRVYRTRGLPGIVHDALFGAPRPQLLRPHGYSALLERLTGPIIFLLALALTGGAVYVMAQRYLLQVFSEPFSALSVLKALVVATLVVVGFALDITLMASGARLPRHLMNREWGWAALAGVMFLGTLTTEGLTWTYLLYQMDPSAAPPHLATFIAQIPGWLFFVRAFAGVICLFYLRVGLLPLAILRSDLDREVAAGSGAAARDLLTEIVAQVRAEGVGDINDALAPLAALMHVFRVATGGAHKTQDDEMVKAVRELVTSVAARGANEHEDGGSEGPALAALPDGHLHALDAPHQPPHDEEDEEEDDAEDNSGGDFDGGPDRGITYALPSQPLPVGGMGRPARSSASDLSAYAVPVS